MAGKENKSNRLFENEKVIEIEIERLRSFKDHPFKVTDDKEMHLLKDSIKQYGVLNPLIVRPVPDGVYEIISGHRRKYAAQQLGYRKVPVIIRVMNDEEAIIKMVDANLQRERISYSEKAFAYKMKNDAMKRTAGRPRSQIDHNLKGKRTVEIIAEETGESPKQVQRYITLTNLIPELLQQLDDELISFNPAVELAALKEKEQKQLIEAMDYAQSVPSLSQAQRIKKLSK
ncbi:MAG: ParB/RepB/Spo0J family partition protein, partial [Clostridia bacterium]|nr:ParB/RepB/Spo0J family partition protein [Clostridia bacterium]